MGVPPRCGNIRGRDRRVTTMQELIPQHEEWRPIPGLQYYEASSLGRIRSLDRRVGNQTRRGRILKQCPNAKGYPRVSCCENGMGVGTTVANLVARAFIGPKPPGLHCCHNNGDKQDSRACNLRYDTVMANVEDAIRHRLRPGVRSHSAKLLPRQVIAIYLAKGSGMTAAEIGLQFGVGERNVCHIWAKQTWCHITNAVDEPARSTIKGARCSCCGWMGAVAASILIKRTSCPNCGKVRGMRRCKKAGPGPKTISAPDI